MMKRLLFGFVFLAALCWTRPASAAGCTNTTYGAFTCVSTATSFGSSTNTHAQTLSVTAGNFVVMDISGLTASGAMTVAGTGSCGGTIDSHGGSVTLGTGVGLVVSTTASSTGTCTLTANWAGTGTIVTTIWQWSGWNGSVDTSGNFASNGSVSSGTTQNCPAVTTAVSGDLILCQMIDGQNNQATYTPQGAFAMVGTGTGLASMQDVQVSAGAITPQFKYGATSVNGAATIAISTGVVTPTFSLAGGTYSTSLPRSTTVATTSGSAYLCVTHCGTSSCTPTTPAASTPGTCSVGTQYNTNSQAITVPPGYNTYSALGTQSGLNNSTVATSPQYLINLTMTTYNGVTPAGGEGGLNRWNGGYINPSTGFLGTFDALISPFSGIAVTEFVNMSGGSNGAAPTILTLGNSTYGTGGSSWGIVGLGAGLTYSNATTFGALPEPVVAGGTAYGDSGSLSLHCVSSINGSGTAASCGNTTLTLPTTGPSTSVGFWYTTPNCNAFGTQDCGAVGFLAGGSDYSLVHVNAGNGMCAQNGIFLETHGQLGGATACLPYVNGTVYRINGQENVGYAALTVTFTNGSPIISATNSLGVNQAIKLTTTGSLPTNFNLQLNSGTYTSGITATGTTGQTCTLTSFNGGGSAASGLLYLNATNTINSGNAISFTNLGSGYTSAPTSATAGNGTATCSGTATIATTRATPILFVSATGLSGSQFELAATQGGTPISAGSAGSGTHTATQYNVMTVCKVVGSSLVYLGTLYGTSDTGAQAVTIMTAGISGEGPTVTGYDFYLGGYVADNSGKISLAQCIL